MSSEGTTHVPGPVEGAFCPKCGGRQSYLAPSGRLVLCGFCPWQEAVPLQCSIEDKLFDTRQEARRVEIDNMLAGVVERVIARDNRLPQGFIIDRAPKGPDITFVVPRKEKPRGGDAKQA